MIEELSPRRARGRAWISATAGSLRAGDPLEEWGHITPQFPQGITNKALEVALPEVQRETALFWFHMNLLRFDPLVGGPYFGFADADDTMALNTAGFDEGVWAPRTYDALSVLTAEFGRTLPEPLIAKIAEGLPGQWQWPDIPIRDQPLPNDLPAATLVGLGRLEEQIASLPAAYGGIGHNNPPPDGGSTDVARILDEIHDLKSELQALQIDKKGIAKRWGHIAAWVGVAVSGMVMHGALEKIGEEMWEHAHKALTVWETAHHIGGLIAQLTALL